MGDLPYSSSEQGGGLIIRSELIYEYTAYVSYTYADFELKKGVRGLIIRTIRYKDAYLTIHIHTEASLVVNEQQEQAHPQFPSKPCSWHRQSQMHCWQRPQHDQIVPRR